MNSIKMAKKDTIGKLVKFVLTLFRARKINADISQFFPIDGGAECVIIVLHGVTMQELEQG